MTKAALEEVLAAAYRREAACYSRALQATGNIDEALRAGRSAPLEELLALFDEVTRIEAEIKEAKQQWQRLGAAPGPVLQGVCAQVAGLIQNLRAWAGAAEQQARAVSDRLLPQLDRLVRGRQMQSAYRGAMASRQP